MQDQTPPDLSPEQQARAAQASLIKSVAVGSNSKPNDMQVRDAKLRAMPNYARPEWTQDDGSKILPGSTARMARLWLLMTDLYGHKWTSVHGLADENETWGKVLGGLDKYQLAHGVKSWVNQGTEESKWPPDAPTLRMFCLSASDRSEVPGIDDAWRQAVEASSAPTEFRYSHPIVREAGRLTDWYSIRTGTPSAQAVQARFNKRYADLVARLQRGEPLIDNQRLIGLDAELGQAGAAQRVGELLADKLAKDQGLHLKTPDELRRGLLEKMGIKR